MVALSTFNGMQKGHLLLLRFHQCVLEQLAHIPHPILLSAGGVYCYSAICRPSAKLHVGLLHCNTSVSPPYLLHSAPF